MRAEIKTILLEGSGVLKILLHFYMGTVFSFRLDNFVMGELVNRGFLPLHHPTAKE